MSQKYVMALSLCAIFIMFFIFYSKFYLALHDSNITTSITTANTIELLLFVACSKSVMGTCSMQQNVKAVHIMAYSTICS